MLVIKVKNDDIRNISTLLLSVKTLSANSLLLELNVVIFKENKLSCFIMILL